MATTWAICAIFIQLPGGIIGTKGQLEAGQDCYLVFTAPTELGDYYFCCDVGTHHFQGMNGELTMAATGGTPGMPRTGAGAAPGSLLISLLVIALLTGGSISAGGGGVSVSHQGS